MYRRRNRPTALDVSFADELTVSSSVIPSDPQSKTGVSKKRKPDVEIVESGFGGSGKDRQLRLESTSDVVRFFPDQTADEETSGTIIPGEGLETEIESTKPVRYLDDFHFFDPKHSYRTIELFDLEKNDGNDRHYEGEGKVSAVMNEEDAGQEDDLGDSTVSLRLSSILRYTVDYTKRNDPIYVETQYAWYRLRMPSRNYLSFYRRFYATHRVAQIVISVLIIDRSASLADLLDDCGYMDHDIMERDLEPADFVNAYPAIFVALENSEHGGLLQNPLLKSIAENKISTATVPRPRNVRRHAKAFAKGSLNLDHEVLQAGNQSQTSVTPLIEHLSTGLFRDSPYVVEYKGNVKEHFSAEQMEAERGRLLELLKIFDQGPAKAITMDNRNRTKGSLRYLDQVGIRSEVFKVGDIAILPMDDLQTRLSKVFVQDDLSGIIADYFWFARILWIDGDTKEAHVQWFEHSSQTLIGEISHPRELFVTFICDNYPLKEIVGKAVVQYIRKGHVYTPSNNLEYFYKFQYIDGGFVDIPDSSLTDQHLPPDNCPVCPVVDQFDFDSHVQDVKDGYAYHGYTYHRYDFIHFIAVDGPCHTGQIIDFKPCGRRDIPYAVVNLLGYMNDIEGNRPRDYIKDERHLCLTNDVDDIPIEDILRKIYVVLPEMVSNLETWISISPVHFYVRYRFPSVRNRSWSEEFQTLEPKDVPYCPDCYSENIDNISSYTGFLEHSPLRALDLFSGVGAFGLGMELSCPMKVTHAIEISPSAAKTLEENSTGIAVYNQCSNEILRYAVDVHNKAASDVPESIEGRKLHPPPQPGDIDVIVAGFPCQPHSSLNMYQRENDRKSHLIMNLLSWVDFLQPRFCFFENVRGFLRYNINSVRTGKHRLEGGISMGGVKYVVRCLLAMDYQTKVALLQAGHYGTPQSRVRFFLFAARRGEVLPDFPQPTHDFPVVDALKIKFMNDKEIQPIHTLRGTAPGHFVTIDDAIGDLPQFDWKGTKKIPSRNDAHEPIRSVPAYECDRSKGRCGSEGPAEYRSDPTTTFQVWCRRKETNDLQHFTRTLKEDTVNRVVHIPLRPKADYRDLPRKLWEWQISNPMSAVARGGFKGGMYGRLDKDQYFQTTVTNVEPTGKQSWVLHPECKRVITVRELARSQGFPDHFVFYSINGDVKTMHRQIGNAVPWQVSIAIGRELKVALVKGWLRGAEGHSDLSSIHGSPAQPNYIEISD